jgi:hypothetical protein
MDLSNRLWGRSKQVLTPFRGTWGEGSISANLSRTGWWLPISPNALLRLSKIAPPACETLLETTHGNHSARSTRLCIYGAKEGLQ